MFIFYLFWVVSLEAPISCLVTPPQTLEQLLLHFSLKTTAVPVGLASVPTVVLSAQLSINILGCNTL